MTLFRGRNRTAARQALPTVNTIEVNGIVKR
jgi:hypothetical protein